MIRERGRCGSVLLTRVQALNDRGPAATAEDERQALVVWSRKMLDRFRGRRDIEAAFRRMNLLTRALEEYFSLRNAWYRGEKESFAWLRQHDASAFGLFDRAARPNASDADFNELVRAVYGASQRPLKKRKRQAKTAANSKGSALANRLSRRRPVRRA